jgi:hypothetical protein
MKKNVLKAMSVGLSAVTIASTLSVPVYADEPAPVTEPAPANSEQQEIPEAGKPAPTNLDEKAAAKDAQTLDERYTNEKDDANFWTEGPKEVLDQVQDVTKAADEDNFPDDTFKDGTKAGEEWQLKPGWWPHWEKEDVTFEDKANDIEDNAENAGKLIHEAAKELAENVKAAEGMDTAKGNADTAVGTINQATSDAASAVNTAEDKVKVAVEAVDNESTRVAGIAVEQATTATTEAEKTLEAKKTEYEETLKEFNEYKAEYEKKAFEYGLHRNVAAGELEVADWNLKAAQQQLAELEKKVQEKQKEYAESAAGQLFTADFMANGNFWTMFDPKYDYENLKAIIQYYVLEGEVSDFNIKPMNPYEQNPKNGDATFEISYVDAKGETQVAHYGFRPNLDGTFDIYDTELKYEYEIVKLDGMGGTTTEVVSKTQSEMEEMVEVGAAVKRYIYTDWAGKHYLTENQLKSMGQKPANYKFEYVIALPNGAHDVWWDPMSENEKYVGEIARFGWFDSNGNYNETILNKTTREFVKVINGAVSYEGTVDNAKSLEAVTNAAEAQFKSNLAEQTALDYVQQYGISGKDYFGNEISITPSEILTIEKVDVKWSDEGQIGIAWTVDGRYVPIYQKNKSSQKPDVKKADYTLEDEWLRVVAGEDQKVSEDEAKAAYQKQHPDRFVKDVKFETNCCGYITKATVTYVESYAIEIGDEFKTRKEALDAVEEYAVAKQEGRDIQYIEHEGYNEFIGYFYGWPVYRWVEGYTETKIKDNVVGAKTEGEYAKKIETDASYSGTGSFVAKVTYNVKDTATMIQHFRQDVVDSLYRKTTEEIFSYAKYAERLKEIQQQTNSYQKLLKETADAKAALEYAKKEVDRIQLELWRLDKDFEVCKTEKDWAGELKLAKLQLDDAQDRFDTLKENLEDASKKLADRLEEERRRQQNQGGPGEEERNYVYNPNVIPTIASIPAVTLPDAGVPLAAATRRVRRVAGVEEVEATEETVEETTPEETTEVTVTETEENPVVIDD